MYARSSDVPGTRPHWSDSSVAHGMRRPIQPGAQWNYNSGPGFRCSHAEHGHSYRHCTDTVCRANTDKRSDGERIRNAHQRIAERFTRAVNTIRVVNAMIGAI